MFKNLYALVLLLLAQICVANPDTPPFTLPNTATFELTAHKLKRIYPVYVSLPRGYNSQDDKKYPVLVVNDGPYAFPVAASALSVPMSMGIIEEIIVVGIGFSKGDNMMHSRIRDYSPSMDSNFKQFSPGQAPQYLDFIKEELLPFIEKHFAADNSKLTLVGHSAGGLFASYVLLNHTELFESYVILSPALFWNNKQLFADEGRYARKYKNLKSRVYFATGSEEIPPAWPYNWVDLQNAFVAQLQKHQYKGLTLKADILQGAVHETSFPIGVLQGVQWLYAKQK